MPKRITDWDEIAERLRRAGPGTPVLVEAQTPRCITLVNTIRRDTPVALRDFPGGVKATMRNGRHMHYDDRVSDVYVTWLGEGG